MKRKFSAGILLSLYILTINYAYSAGLEKRVITLSSNERFELLQAETVSFKFQPLSDEARKLEITNDATSLGVAYLGQVKLRENISALSALRSIADQIGESLDINFGVIADSNTSDALKANELLLLYHPSVTITLALAKPAENSDYEIICTYALKDLSQTEVVTQISTEEVTEQSVAVSPQSDKIRTEAENSDIAPTESIPESLPDN